MKHKIHTITVLLLLSAAAHGQADSTAMDSINRYSAHTLCASYGVDTRILDDHSKLRIIIDSLSALHEHPYLPISNWCHHQQTKTEYMINSMRNTLRWDGEMAWIDSTNCITDASFFTSTLQRSAAWLESQSAFYKEKENDRLEQERRKREEQERREALRIQREKEAHLKQLHDTISMLHRDISIICDGRNVSDKRRRNALNSFYLAYKHIYNRYNTANSSVDDNNFAQMAELKNFQLSLKDSTLGSNGLLSQIADFGNTLKMRADKNHAEVNKSYTKIFKKVEVPIDFTTLKEYGQYMNRLREIRYVQTSYLTVIDLREEIAHNTAQIQTISKKRNDLIDAYKEVLDAQILVPSYTTRENAEAFIKHLNDFISLQQSYIQASARLDVIDHRSDSIFAACTKKISDVGAAYKTLLNTTDLVPHLNNKGNVDTYNTTLDNFEQVQQIYLEIIGMRNTIATKDDAISNHKSAPKGLMSYYKMQKKSNDFTPRFANPRQGNDFKSLLLKYLQIQDKYMVILNNNDRIESNTKQLNTILKEFKNLSKSYGIVMKSYDMDISILTETDLDNYIRHQEEVLEMQQHYTDVVASGQASDYNIRLKKEKDPHNIKVLIGIND